jgi:HAD superfamily hydrolase (TIGR01509 family)
MVVRALLFDYGGTLDSPGVHWLDRFLHLYRDGGLDLAFETFRDAFDSATQSAYHDRRVATLDLRGVVAFHVHHHLERLGIRDDGLAQQVIAAFVDSSERCLRENRALLARLRPRVQLGVVSNFYGNLERLLADAEIAPLLSTVIDSGRVGVSKPDPAIFALALKQLGSSAANVMYVGDSFEKDIVGARAAGLRTAWLVGAGERPCAQPDLVDVRLRSLAELDTLIG